MKRSKCSLSYGRTLTHDAGFLIPIGLTQVLPGDSVQHATSALIRLSPLLAPVMHRMEAHIHHWFVPHRLVWEDWEDFITGGSDATRPDGIPASAPVFPTIAITNTAADDDVGTLKDFLGYPSGADCLTAPGTLNLSALPLRGYSLIFNEWYRDQDMENPETIDLTSGPDTTTNITLLSVSWEKDYFTTARPWSQKGPAISIPLTADEVDVTRKSSASPAWKWYQTGSNTEASAGGGGFSSGNLVDGAAAGVTGDPLGTLEVDLASAMGTIQDLRLAGALLRYEEARAQYGSRYTEYLRYLGVNSSDARLQRPEYLGGGKQVVQFSEVLQTGVTTDGDDQEGVGNLKGHGISAMRSNRYRRFFEEHGYIHSVMFLRPKLMYTNIVPKHLLYTTKEDFFQKELQFIGQQEVLEQEAYAFGATPNSVFGYVDRYSELRCGLSTIHGDFKETLDFWTMARIFGSTPALNPSYVTCDPTDRIFAVPGARNYYTQVNHSIQARRIVGPTGGRARII